MTRYTRRFWYPYPENEVLRLWLDASNRQAVTDAANAIDQELQFDPETKGSPVRDDLRELVIDPLRVLYRISIPDRLVKVTSIAFV